MSKQAEAGKGSKSRPTDLDAYDTGWDRIFGNKKKKVPEKETPKTDKKDQ